MADAHVEDSLDRLRKLGRLMDSAFKVPVINYPIGLDGLIGLIPGLGDVVTGGVSLYIIVEAARLGVSRSVLLRMALNVLIDVVLGAIPIVGDLIDFVWKANDRNIALVERHISRRSVA